MFNQNPNMAYLTTQGIHTAGGDSANVTDRLTSMSLRMNTIQIDLSTLMTSLGTVQAAVGKLDALIIKVNEIDDRLKIIEAKVP